MPAARRVCLWLLGLLPLGLAAAPVPGDLAWKVSTSTKVVALTFDDGPGRSTRPVLDLLNKYNVHATFFMLGELAKSQPDLVKAVVMEGHEAQSHAYTHRNFAHVPEQEGIPALTDSLQKTKDALEKITGQPLKYVRMPHGVDRPWIRGVARQQGSVLVNWTFGYDWSAVAQEEMAEAYVRNLNPGAIILMHDGGRRPKTLYALEALLKAMREKGYQAVTVSELLRRYPAMLAKSRKQ